MALSTRLRAYLALERVMVDLDHEGDPIADLLRDRMDPIWYALTEEDRDLLDSRAGDKAEFAGSLAEPSDAAKTR